MPCSVGNKLCGFTKDGADSYAERLKKSGAIIKVYRVGGSFCVEIIGMKNNPKKKNNQKKKRRY